MFPCTMQRLRKRPACTDNGADGGGGQEAGHELLAVKRPASVDNSSDEELREETGAGPSGHCQAKAGRELASGQIVHAL